MYTSCSTKILLTIFLSICLAFSTLACGKKGDSGLYPILKNLKYGYMDKNGKVIIEPKFDKAFRFTEGLAMTGVYENGSTKYGYIDEYGKTIIENKYDRSMGFSEGLAAVMLPKEEGGKMAYIDKNGQVVIKTDSESVGNFKEGLACILSGNTNPSPSSIIERFVMKDFPSDVICSFIDIKGNVKIEPKYNVSSTVADGFSDGLFKTRKGNDWIFIDKSGNNAFSSNLYNIRSFKEGLACYSTDKTDKAKYGFINKNGKIVIDAKFDYAEDFSEGMALVRIGDMKTGKYGYIDKNGKYIIEPQYNKALSYSEGLACVRTSEGGKWGFVDKNGNIVIEPQFDVPASFSSGLAEIIVIDYKVVGTDKNDGVSIGYIDKKGKTIWNIQN